MLAAALVVAAMAAVGAAAQTSSWSSKTNDSDAPKSGSSDGGWKTRAAQPRVVRPQSAPARRAAPYTTKLEPKAAALRERLRNFLIVTPGIRSEGSDHQDQTRVVTPKIAIEAGADYLVIGRPITRAKDPRAVAQEIAAEIASVSR